MKPKYFLVITAVIAAILGIVFIALRSFAMGLSGAMGAGLIAQILGANFIGFAVLNFFARNLNIGEGLKIILSANFVSNALGFVLMVLFGLTSGLNLYGWITTAIYLIFTFGFGFYLLYEPRPALASVPCPEPPC